MQKIKKTDKFYLIWAILFSVLPILVSLLDLVKIKLDIQVFLWVSFFVFIAILLIRFVLLMKNDYQDTANKIKIFFTSTMKKPIPILIAICVFFVLISSFINGFNVHSFIFLSYFVILLCCFKVYTAKNLIIHLMLITTAICCIMGFIDPLGKFMPGFQSSNLALQFYNPNHSAYVMAIMLVLSAGLMQKCKALILELFYSLISLIYVFFLFMNGSFASITFAFMSLGLMFIFYIIKYRKFPIKITVALISMILVCLFVEFIPDINSYRTCPYNYLIEVIDAINHYFKANIPIPKMWGTSKDFLSTNSTMDVYTFTERQELLENSKNAIFDSAKNVLLGFGGGAHWDYAPHNILMSLTLEFGIFVPICLTSILIICFVKFFKNKTNHNSYYIFISLFCFFMCGMTGSLMAHSAIYLFIILGLCLRIQDQ